MNRSARRWGPAVASLVIIGFAAVPVSAAPSTAGDAGPARSTVSSAGADVLAALRRDLGMSTEEASRRLAQQTEATELESTLGDRLGAAYAGSWFDSKSGRLVVAVTDAGLVAEVTAAGADARVVKHSQAVLDGIKSELDELAGVGKADVDRARAAEVVQDRAAVAGLTGWRVDPKTNSVVVTVLKGQAKPNALEVMSKHGSAVRTEEFDSAPVTTANFMDGGDPMTVSGLGCSAGFNARTAAGQGYLLTAGHCHRLGTGNAVHGQDGAYFGPVLESWFPSFDDAVVRNDNPGHWIQGPWVDNDPGYGPVHIVRGWRDSPVGSVVCKSGRTTKVTCGYIDAKNETVNYAEGTVYGLTRHSACVEPGDSGGSNFSGWSDVYAEGITSGGYLWFGLCLQKVGLRNVSYYQPVASTLAYYGPRYGLTLWTA